jgi:hypothetical protein
VPRNADFNRFGHAFDLLLLTGLSALRAGLFVDPALGLVCGP